MTYQFVLLIASSVKSGVREEWGKVRAGSRQNDLQGLNFDSEWTHTNTHTHTHRPTDTHTHTYTHTHTHSHTHIRTYTLIETRVHWKCWICQRDFHSIPSRRRRLLTQLTYVDFCNGLVWALLCIKEIVHFFVVVCTLSLLSFFRLTFVPYPSCFFFIAEIPSHISLSSHS